VKQETHSRCSAQFDWGSGCVGVQLRYTPLPLCLWKLCVCLHLQLLLWGAVNNDVRFTETVRCC
jgi:hypothetical protein